MKNISFTRKEIGLILVLVLSSWIMFKKLNQEANQEATTTKEALARLDGANNRLNPQGLFITKRPLSNEQAGNLFNSPIQIVVEKESPSAPKEVAPMTPSIPFNYLGLIKFQDDNKVIFSYMGEVVILKIGGELAGFRLLSITQENKLAKLNFLHIATKTNQVMMFNETN
jgi:hypothetical protein